MSIFRAFFHHAASTRQRGHAGRLVCAGLLVLLSACGGGDDGSGESAASTAAAGTQSSTPAAAGDRWLPQVKAVQLPSSTQPPATEMAADAVAAQPATQRAAVATVATVVAPFNNGVEDPGLLMLLLPDDQPATDPRVTAWLDAASETGTRIAVVTDAQFLAMAPAKALKYAGLVLPDQLHVIATDALLASVRSYVTAGGRALLTYDFGALTLNANNQPVYPIPKSRLSDLAGVDYVLYDALLGQMVGLGPVTAMRSTMRELLVPPGKSLPYNLVQSSATASEASAVAPGTGQAPTGSNGLLGAARLAVGEALYLPTSPGDPGGVKGFDPQQFQSLPSYSVQDRQRSAAGQVRARSVTVDFGKAFKGRQPAAATRVQPAGLARHPLTVASAEASQASASLAGESLQAAEVDTLDAYNGYLLGHLIYPTYVTTGTYAGTPLALSPSFGLVAGIQTTGTGKVLFVNMPLTYLKGRTDALPMHGFLRYFMEHLVQGAHLSAMPNGVAGMTLDWHLDSMAAQQPSLHLEAAGVFNTHKFSMEMTAGPDTIVPGDGLGWNLNNNTVAQQLLSRLDAKGHAIGSHGGWIHDDYGLNATENNAAEFQPYLVQNRSAVDTVVGRPARGYSAPQGNNPPWAMTWLEQQGVVAAYFGGHTGLGATRQYRDGVLLNPALWVFPVTPQGTYATFEEWQDYNVPKAEVNAWYQAMVDFSVNYNTSRMVYAHPPGANDWIDVVKGLLAYGQTKGAKFRWYTMPRLADFMATRNQVGWTQTLLANGTTTRFTATHPTTMAEMVWMLPKARYLRPTIVTAGSVTVSDGGTVWLVTGKPVTQAQFQAQRNPAFIP
ncbi:hypothetical protein AVHY2522_19780 [Acidovorax sp. SUPP2522]|uniref:polysaccharide deacetylase family protein n=1 Tax=unclassified Acidovorax TaxID=2684926 RepID=UPI00234BF7C9|nr:MULTISPECIES: polysaccharide deacetylase family protein [unclassified Acidovorax]WCM99267.1 polysaccharide deacetylase family protein [Acidovorax sp. GBBC 1281]GKT18692.1 hypothetical protein AVHY2522_19780 [Acidovorax sp. SUPP2522]